MDNKRILCAVFALTLKGKKATARSVAGQLGSDETCVRESISRLVDSGRLRTAKGVAALTKKGRRAIKVVFIGGGFEVIHHGHIYTIEKARSLGDMLVVAVATDSTIRRRKAREPIANEEERARMLSSLRQVDAAVIGSEGDIFETLVKVKPDIVALGYDQYHSESDVAKGAEKRGVNVRIVRLGASDRRVKTSSLLSDY